MKQNRKKKKNIMCVHCQARKSKQSLVYVEFAEECLKI